MYTYALLKQEKVPLCGLLSFELKSISEKIYRRLFICYALNNLWKVVVTHNIHSLFVYFIFVMLLCITKFLNYVIIKYIFCFHPCTNVDQPNAGMASTICTFFMIPLKQGRDVALFWLIASGNLYWAIVCKNKFICC